VPAKDLAGPRSWLDPPSSLSVFSVFFLCVSVSLVSAANGWHISLFCVYRRLRDGRATLSRSGNLELCDELWNLFGGEVFGRRGVGDAVFEEVVAEFEEVGFGEDVLVIAREVGGTERVDGAEAF